MNTIKLVSKGEKKAEIVIVEFTDKHLASSRRLAFKSTTIHLLRRGEKWFDRVGKEYDI